MMPKGLTGVWSVAVLAALVPGICLQKNDSATRPAAELPSDPQVRRPALQPHEAIPPIGAYTLRSHEGKPCIKVTMGAEYIILRTQKSWYFNLDPSRVQISGHCDKEDAVLSLALPDNSASLQFTFRKDLESFYVTQLSAHISPLPVCQRCPNKTYSGLLDHDKLFATANNKSFMCKSENLLLMSSELMVKLVPLQMQAFTLTNGLFGKEVECWADFAKKVIPIIIGAAVVGFFLIAVLTCLLIKDRHRSGYNRI